jgi:SAM-dependent methyltransferase
VTLDFQLDYWDRVGPTKCFAHPVNVEQFKQWVEPASRILDYGCGYGRALSILKANGFTNLIGVDPAPAMIAAARERCPGATFEVLDDFRHTPLASASIDAVLLFAVLTCVPTNEGQSAIIAEITRVLRPGGILYISDMFLQTDARNLERYRCDDEKYGIYGVFELSEGVTVRHHEREWIDSLLDKYQLLALHEIEVQTMNGHPASAFQWFGRNRATIAALEPTPSLAKIRRK